MASVVITPPAEQPITVEYAKLHSRVTHNAEDALYLSYIKAATLFAEHHMGRSIMPQIREQRYDGFPSDYHGIRLEMPPVRSITGVYYWPANGGAELELSNLDYHLDTEVLPAWVVPNNGVVWPAVYSRASALRVRYAAGWADAASVPENIKVWIAVAVNQMIEHRGFDILGLTVSPNRFTRSMLDPHKARF